jgi:hypothetical protein
MSEYAFPNDLLDGIKTRWQTVPDQQFELPEDRILQRLLETCYHASFRTSEQRAVHCVVALRFGSRHSGGGFAARQSSGGID